MKLHLIKLSITIKINQFLNTVKTIAFQKLIFFQTENADLGTAIGQIHSTFILAQNKSGIVIIDMHAAHERINFELLKEQWTSGEIQKQKALFPIEISLTEFEAEEIEQKSENLTQCGFVIDRISKTTISIKEYPFIFTKKHFRSSNAYY